MKKLSQELYFKISTIAALIAGAIASAAAAPVNYEEPTYNYINFTKKAGKWESDKNWTKKTVPGPEHTVIIRDNAGASISSKVASISGMHIGGEKTSVLTISNGGELEVQNKIRIGRTAPDTEGTLVLDGGTLRMGVGNERAGARLNVGESATHSSRGIAIFKSGVFEGGIAVGSQLANTGAGILRIDGSAPSVNAKIKRDLLITTPYARIEFILDAEGCATLDYRASGVRLAKGSQILIDGSAYAGKSRTIVLIESKNIKNDGANVECVNFPENYSATASFEKNRGLVLKIKAKS